MKQSGKALLILIAAIFLLAAAAVFLHSPASRPLWAHLQHVVHGGPHAAPDTEALATTARAKVGIAAIGRRWDARAFEETVALYTDVHRDLEWPGLLDPETIAYGPDAQQTFDLFRPEQGFSEPGPVFVYVHGNGLGALDWQIPESQGTLWANVGRIAATFGGLGVVMNYRTGEHANAVTGAEDLRLVVDWLKQNIAPYGGDPETIVVMANSEGATLTARYLFDADVQLESGPGLAAVVLSSGLFGQDPELGSLVDSYQGGRVQLALMHGEYDTEEVIDGVAELHHRICEAFGECPTFREIAGHNHVSHMMSFGTDDTYVLNELIVFYHTVR